MKQRMKPVTRPGKWRLFLIVEQTDGSEQAVDVGVYESRSRARKAARKHRVQISASYTDAKRTSPTMRYGLVKLVPKRITR